MKVNVEIVGGADFSFDDYNAQIFIDALKDMGYTDKDLGTKQSVIVSVLNCKTEEEDDTDES